MFEAYRIGIRLSLINNVTSGLKVISGNFSEAHRDAVKFQDELKKIKLLGAAGVAIGGAGFMGLNLFGKAVKPAEEYAHQLTQMNIAGMKHVEIVKATQAAWDTARSIPTSSVNENLAEIRELRMVFRGITEDAIKYMPTVQKLQGSLATVRHGHGQAKDEAYGIAKALEMKGAVKDPTHFTHEADLMARAIVASGGKISANDFQRTFTLGRSATSGWSNEFAYEILPTLMQEMKGGASGQASNPGTALMSSYAAIVGGTISQKSLKLWQELGLIDMKKAVFTKDGHLKGLLPGGIIGGEEFQHNPFKYAQDYIQKSLMAHGYDTEAKQKLAYQYLFPNRTAGFVMTQFGMQPWKFEGDQKLIQNTPSAYKSYDDMLEKDPVMKRMALQKQWETMLTVFGNVTMPTVIAVMGRTISVIQTVTDWTRKHETATHALVWGFVGLSGAMAIGGTLMTVTAGFKGLRLMLRVFSGEQGVAGAKASVKALTGAMGQGGLLTALVALIPIAYELSKALPGGGQKLFDWTHSKDGTTTNSMLIWALDHAIGVDTKMQWAPKGLGAEGAPDMRGAFDRSGAIRVGNKKQPIELHTKVELDGRTVAQVVSKHQADDMERHMLGIGGFDSSMSPYPVSF